jgi:hypothetical protein
MIAVLLEQWGLLTIIGQINPETDLDRDSMHSIKIVPFAQKSKWNLVTKYTIGKPSNN